MKHCTKTPMGVMLVVAAVLRLSVRVDAHTPIIRGDMTEESMLETQNMISVEFAHAPEETAEVSVRADVHKPILRDDMAEKSLMEMIAGGVDLKHGHTRVKTVKVEFSAAERVVESVARRERTAASPEAASLAASGAVPSAPGMARSADCAAEPVSEPAVRGGGESDLYDMVSALRET